MVELTRGVIQAFEGGQPRVEMSTSPETLALKADEALVKVLLQNVIDNAVKFSPSDRANVDVRLRQDSKGVTIVVELPSMVVVRHDD